ncbi:MAG: aminotransferase class III-fold pyridoxal phosphate-dependent enzyme, partial [Gemmatimonadales bacterium]|nr:aminotransferase class III-fold pyridoxal phosphate-dependent enzyme [Gemmatimonadales bacterium]
GGGRTAGGAGFMAALEAIDSPHVDHVRGRGLFIGVVVRDESGSARPFCEALQARGILAKETHEQVIRFAPPLTIEKASLEWALENIAEVLEGAAVAVALPARRRARGRGRSRKLSSGRPAAAHRRRGPVVPRVRPSIHPPAVRPIHAQPIPAQPIPGCLCHRSRSRRSGRTDVYPETPAR